VSGTLLAAATGLVLGGAAGMPVALLGATLGGTVAFFAARRLGRGPAEALAGPRVTRLRDRVEQRPLLTIVLARLAPGSPATILNYAAGLTRIRYHHFVAGSLIGGGPRVLAYTALGGAAGSARCGPPSRRSRCSRCSASRARSSRPAGAPPPRCPRPPEVDDPLGLHPGALRVRIARGHPGASPSAFEPGGTWDALRALVAIAAGRGATAHRYHAVLDREAC
jgi:hypothetical protein